MSIASVVESTRGRSRCRCFSRGQSLRHVTTQMSNVPYSIGIRHVYKFIVSLGPSTIVVAGIVSRMDSFGQYVSGVGAGGAWGAGGAASFASPLDSSSTDQDPPLRNGVKISFAGGGLGLFRWGLGVGGGGGVIIFPAKGPGR